MVAASADKVSSSELAEPWPQDVVGQGEEFLVAFSHLPFGKIDDIGEIPVIESDFFSANFVGTLRTFFKGKHALHAFCEFIIQDLVCVFCLIHANMYVVFAVWMLFQLPPFIYYQVLWVALTQGCCKGFIKDLCIHDVLIISHV